MPLPVWLAHRVVRRLDTVRSDRLPYLAPHGSCQGGVAYADQAPARIHSIPLVAPQRDEASGRTTLQTPLQQALEQHVINPVFAGALLDERCAVQLSSTIGQAHPVNVRVGTMGSGRAPDAVLTEAVQTVFDFRLGGIVRRFGLRHLAQTHGERIFRTLARYGPVGRSALNLPRGVINQANALRGAV